MRPEAWWPSALLIISLAGCSIGLSGPSGVLRNAEDVPNHFEPKNPDFRIMPADTIAGSGCLSPMVDPRDGTEIGFLRSDKGEGDYAVPGRMYAVGTGELLRLDCNTGKVIGVVRR
jgi:hypothetical protein